MKTEEILFGKWNLTHLKTDVLFLGQRFAILAMFYYAEGAILKRVSLFQNMVAMWFEVEVGSKFTHDIDFCEEACGTALSYENQTG